eukprot:TRINITY_DN24384_c0_g1_i1.p1 TRINITY_DN24384_c0_g1~~TRINITY_DN24384_c0_g1_i1.p1  ORF type:complete len:188 (-),score=25.37 TRINITY_DN24384_c0_g1_i1:109-672(-)
MCFYRLLLARPEFYPLPKTRGSSFLGSPIHDVKLSELEWRKKLSEKQYQVLRVKATEPGNMLKFPLGFDDHFESGVYFCAGCLAVGCYNVLYTSRMKFECGCGWPGFWTNVKGAVYESLDADGSRQEILCARCAGHLGHVYRGEGYGYCTDERHCVNSLSLVFSGGGGPLVVPTYDRFLRAPNGACV